jgi:hypothetical protein
MLLVRNDESQGRERECVLVTGSGFRTVRSSIRMGWDNMVSGTIPERFVFRDRTGPFCPTEYSKMQLCGHRKKSEKTDWDVSVRVFDV